MNDLKKLIGEGITLNHELDADDVLKLSAAIFGAVVLAIIVGHGILNAIK